jgi:hypothetical protein
MSYHRRMALLLPGERAPAVLFSSSSRFEPLPPQSPLWGAVVAVLAVVALCALGCAAPAHTRRSSPSGLLTAHHRARGAHHVFAGDEGSRFVERALQHDGLRFGTDGSTRALWRYLRISHSVVSPQEARPGDVVFFATAAGGDSPSCDVAADHAGLVTEAEPGGRLTFVEARGGRIRTSFVDPSHPNWRRGPDGQVVNTFVRAKAVGDPPGTRYFAGELLCGVARPERPDGPSRPDRPDAAGDNLFAKGANVVGTVRR